MADRFPYHEKCKFRRESEDPEPYSVELRWIESVSYEIVSADDEFDELELVETGSEVVEELYKCRLCGEDISVDDLALEEY